jgi:AraC-like DNA-binding protein
LSGGLVIDGRAHAEVGVAADFGDAHPAAHPTANGTITRLAYAKAKAVGLDLAPIVKKAGLTALEIETPNTRLKVHDQIRFLDLVANALHDDFLGFHLASQVDLREMGWIYYVAASSQTLGQALARAARYSSMANEGISLTYADSGDVSVTIDYVGVSRHSDRHQIECMVTALVRMARQLTSQRLMPKLVTFIHHRDPESSEFQAFFGGHLVFGAKADRVTFAATVKDTPVTTADPYLNKLLVTYCEEARSRRPGARGALRSSVENAIVPLLPHGKARAADIAKRLGMTQRTVARRLSAERLTFTGVLESLRFDLAQRYLADEDISISEIAWLLGYQEVSAFTHAFRRWTGKTPRETRSEILTKQSA